MGMDLRTYEHTVPPANRAFHEHAEIVLLYAEGILPLEDDDDGIDPDVPLDGSQSPTKTIRE